MLEKLHVYVSIIAALVVTIMSLIQKISLQETTLRLIVIICVFYIIGLITRTYLKKNVFIQKPADDIPLDGIENIETENSDDKFEVEEESAE